MSDLEERTKTANNSPEGTNDPTVLNYTADQNDIVNSEQMAIDIALIVMNSRHPKRLKQLQYKAYFHPERRTWQVVYYEDNGMVGYNIVIDIEAADGSIRITYGE